MQRKFRSLRDYFVASAPAPDDETPEYARFMKFFLPISVLVNIAFSYLSVYLPTQLIAASHARICSPNSVFEDRCRFLEQFDLTSRVSFVGALLVGFTLFPTLLAVHIYGYWKAVISSRGVSKLPHPIAFPMAFAWGIVVLFFWVAFIDVPGGYELGRMGFARILIWPLLPGLGGFAWWFLELAVLATLVGLIKWIAHYGESHG